MTRRKLLSLLGFTSVLSAIGGTFWYRRNYRANPYYSGPVSDHFDGRVFFNPNGVPPGKFSDLMKWQFTETKAEWPPEFPSEYSGAKPEPRVEGENIVVTMIGHATLLVQVNGLNILTDPVMSNRASPFQFAGPKRVNPPGVLFGDLPKIDVVLLSHNHYDHLDVLTLEKLVSRDNPKIVTPLGNDTIVLDAVPDAQISIGDWGDSLDLQNGTKVHFEPCHHWSARGTSDRRMALWAAFVIETPSAKIYHIGDTGFHSGINYKAAADKYGSFDLAILPIGAYEPRWFMKGQHQNPEEAVEGLLMCNATTAIGHHWGTFQLTNEAIEAPVEALIAALDKREVARDRFVPLLPGQSWRRSNLA